MPPEAAVKQPRRMARERSRVSRMIGRWPEGVWFEDAMVPAEPFFRGGDREAIGVWPESSLTAAARIARRR